MTPIAETLAALDELVARGGRRARSAAPTSAPPNWRRPSGSRAERGLARFVTLQNHYSLLERGIEAEVAPACERLGVSILPFFPLAKGLLSGKYRRGESGPEGTRLAGGERPAATRSSTWSRRSRRSPRRAAIGRVDVAIAGLAAQPAVASVIAGATEPEQVRANVAALRWQPSAEDLAELDRIAPTART